MNGHTLRIVLDTNIVVSAMLTRNGLEANILRLALNGELRLYTSLPILKEYGEVLQRPKFGFSRNVLKEILQNLKSVGTVVEPGESLRYVPIWTTTCFWNARKRAMRII